MSTYITYSPGWNAETRPPWADYELVEPTPEEMAALEGYLDRLTALNREYGFSLGGSDYGVHVTRGREDAAILEFADDGTVENKEIVKQQREKAG